MPQDQNNAAADKAIWSAFERSGLRPKHVGRRFSSKGQVLFATGWHADGTPFAFASAPFHGNPVQRSIEVVAGLIAAHGAQLSADASTSQRTGKMGKLETVADRMSALKAKLDGRADRLLKRVEDAEHRGNEAFDKNEAILDQTDREIAEMEQSIAQVTNGPQS
jgi:hypothetical protein